MFTEKPCREEGRAWSHAPGSTRYWELANGHLGLGSLPFRHFVSTLLGWLVCSAQLKNPFSGEFGGSSWNSCPTVWTLSGFLGGFSRIERCSNQYTALRLIVLLSRSTNLGKLSESQAGWRWVLRDHNEGGCHQGDKRAARLQTDVSTQARPINLIIIELTQRLC